MYTVVKMFNVMYPSRENSSFYQLLLATQENVRRKQPPRGQTLMVMILIRRQ